MDFSDDQLNAASAFAHTMIVVDDEPINEPASPEPSVEVKTPGRRDVVATQEEAEVPEAKHSHSLDAKGLIKSALDLGLICSVVNPSGDEVNVAKSVAKASKRADIVSLDWHMNHDDDGELASEIIKEILIGDEENGGRLRLIGIYTGNKDRPAILAKLTQRLNDTEELRDKIVNHGEVLTNSTGLRLIWRLKSVGNKKLPNAVSEKQLPKVFLVEFAKLSDGLLSNVALATISSMRDTTHHVLGKFSSNLDGPFFHHRALLENSPDSMDYAVSVIMSALKSEVDKSQVTSQYTTVDAIKRRLSAMSQNPDNFTLRYLNKKKEPKEFKLKVEEILHLMGGGFSSWSDAEKDLAHERQENKEASPFPPKDAFLKNFSSLFYETSELANISMRQFSFLTNSQSSELSRIHRTTPPRLDLGSVIHLDPGEYYLCLQATCDTVRGPGLFFFIPLEINDGAPDIVVPHGKTNNNKPNYIGLTVPAKCYTKSFSLDFGVIDNEVGHIPISYDPQRKIYHVADAKDIEYRWLANLKYKKALRIAQNMSQEISRIGFDEFEPFRSKS